jgi:DNA polymerase
MKIVARAQNAGRPSIDAARPSGCETNSAFVLLFLGETGKRRSKQRMSRKSIIAAASDSGPVVESLSALRAAESECRRCPLYKNATQAVPGQGPRLASMMLVGEQPGDQEDKAGLPFVGPAGRILDRALEEAGVERKRVFVTNAVKHFKYEMRGKRRLHKRPNAYEIDRCRWWQAQERAIVKPSVIVALGATAARSVLGRPTTIAKARGRVLTLDDGAKAFVTLHPSALLRIQDEEDKRRAYRSFVDDLRLASKALEA